MRPGFRRSGSLLPFWSSLVCSVAPARIRKMGSNYGCVKSREFFVKPSEFAYWHDGNIQGGRWTIVEICLLVKSADCLSGLLDIQKYEINFVL